MLARCLIEVERQTDKLYLGYLGYILLPTASVYVYPLILFIYATSATLTRCSLPLLDFSRPPHLFVLN